LQENDIAPERHWFFPAEECRWVALRRRASPSSVTNRRICRRFRRQRKIRTACRNESPGGFPRYRVRFAPADRSALAPSKEQSAPPSEDRLPAFVAVAQSKSGLQPD